MIHARQMARLARIALTPEQEAVMEEDLKRVVAWVGQLSDVVLQDDADEALTAPAITPLRADTIQATLKLDQVLANAPAPAQAYFTVPKVLE